MKILRDGTSLRQVATLFNEGITGAVTDGQLLERFATRRGETSEHAFAALVERHGPVVMRLCRSVLRDEHEAQDAFQATFLVLAQRAGSLWVRDSIGPWIHSVAYRVASCARAAGIRRQRHERRHAELAAGRLAFYHDEDRGDIEGVVHEEINRLPAHYRAPLVLCDLEGCTHEQAARHLGLPVGTVKSRQARGRQRLRDRLLRRGLAPSSGLVLGAALPPALPVPAALMKATTNLATTWAGADSARVAVLAKGVLTVMFLQQLKRTVLLLTMIALASAGAGSLIWQAMAAMPREGQATPAAPVAGQAAPVAKPERTGKIYITVRRADPRRPILTIPWLMALDPQTGARADVFDQCSVRPRVSPDGKSVAFERERKSVAFERENALWVRGLDPKAEPRKVVNLDVYSGAPPVWSPDGKQIIISLGREAKPNWVFTTIRVNVDGTGWEGCDLRLMSAVNDVSGLPREGKNRIVVAAIGNGLHFRIFDPDGKMAVDRDERSLTEKAQPIQVLKEQLQNLWPPHEMTGNEKDRIINAVTSIVGHTRQEKLAIPPEDTVQDWSADGRWLLTASFRGAKIGWQLYVMRPDGTDQRRITDGGNPFYARFSPDGRRVLYTDGVRGKESGIRVVDVNGRNDRLLFPVNCNTTKPSACWSPDGKRVAIILADMLTSLRQVPTAPVQVVVMDLDGGHRLEVFIPEGGRTDMPDWR